jgi:hypothetical protein
MLGHVIISGAYAPNMMTGRCLVKRNSTPYDDGRIIEGDKLPERTDWEEHAKGIIRGEMGRRGVTYAQLAEKLSALGVIENERNLRNKVSRGKFTAGFLLQALKALGVQSVRIDE